MSRDPAPVQQAALRKDKSSSAHARQAPYLRRCKLDRTDIWRPHRPARATYHDERVKRSPLERTCIDWHAEAVADGASRHRHHLHAIQRFVSDPICRCKRRHRASQVEEKVTRVEQKSDVFKHGVIRGINVLYAIIASVDICFS